MYTDAAGSLRFIEFAQKQNFHKIFCVKKLIKSCPTSYSLHWPIETCYRKIPIAIFSISDEAGSALEDYPTLGW